MSDTPQNTDVDPLRLIFKKSPILSARAANAILADYENRIPATFRITPYFSPYVRFWFNIYTRYTSSHVVIHDKEDLSIIYEVLDFTRTRTPETHRYTKAKLRDEFLKKKTLEVVSALQHLADEGPSHQTLPIMRALEHSQSPPPRSPAERRKFFLKRAQSVRSQTGQRNRISAGLHRAAPFLPFLERMFFEFHLPPQLLAIPFLESSFNPSAGSRVGAAGIWQFMPLIASHYLPRRNRHVDYRFNPLVSSAAAAHLLRDNFNILKRWDLAVTAYNSGTKHLVLARKEIGASGLTLETVFANYDHDHLGFASKNFYSEFLALVYATTYRHETFPEISVSAGLPRSSHVFAIAKCSFSPKQLTQNPGAQHEIWAKLNTQFFNPLSMIARGTLVVDAGLLPKKQFYFLDWKTVVKHRPISWSKSLGHQSCSTR